MSVSLYAAGLAGIGGGVAFAKGFTDLKNPEIDKKIAKAEIIGGGIALTLSALKISSYLIDFAYSPNIILNEEDFFNSKIYLFNSDAFTEHLLNSLIILTLTPLSFFCTNVCYFGLAGCCFKILER